MMLVCKNIKNNILDIGEFYLVDGQRCALIGPSGCGKTTFLKILLGLIQITTGRISYKDSLYTENTKIIVKPNNRGFAMVDQHSVLFPHLTVWENITLGDSHKYKKASMWLNLLQLEELKNRPATQLSGGQQQRICLIRALVDEPKVLLLDEPFNNVDMPTRRQLYKELINILNKHNTQLLLVTHDFNEVLNLCDYVWVMKDGIIHTHDSVQNLYSNPSDKWTANFIDECIDFTERQVQDLFGLKIGCLTTRPKYISIVDGKNYNLSVVNTFYDGAITTVVLKNLTDNSIFKAYTYEKNINVGSNPAIQLTKYWRF